VFISGNECSNPRWTVCEDDGSESLTAAAPDGALGDEYEVIAQDAATLLRSLFDAHSQSEPREITRSIDPMSA
jgi:hypothetical protein